MHAFRTYGEAPYPVAVIHGGPGAAGEMAPVARVLSSHFGVLEPLQTVSTLDMQVQELKEVLHMQAKLPATLIGHSWGAMLSYIITAQNPECVKKVILVSSGVFDADYAKEITEALLNRLSHEDRGTLTALLKKLDDPLTTDKDALFRQCGDLLARCDSFDPISHASEGIACQYEIYKSVWSDAERLRLQGNLLSYGRHITCPVVAIHGDYDPHPADGINIPLSKVLHDLRFVLLEHCGHYPCIERLAQEQFYEILAEELKIAI